MLKTNVSAKIVTGLILVVTLTVSTYLVEAESVNAQSDPKPPLQVLKSVTNESVPVPNSHMHQMLIPLEKNDRIQGNFSVSHIRYFPKLPRLNLQAEVLIRAPSGQWLFHTYSTGAESFNFTASQSGVYTISTLSNLMTELIHYYNGYGIDSLDQFEAPQLTLNYQILGQPLELDVLSPKNQTQNDANASLCFSVNRLCDWVGYCLDGAEVVSVWISSPVLPAGGFGYPTDTMNTPSYWNTTLTNLAAGTHTLTLYANDTNGNTDNRTIVFTVGSPATASTVAMLPMVTIVIVIAVVLLAVAFFYRRHGR